MAQNTCRIVTLPRLDHDLGAYDERAIRLGQKYRNFRLFALKTSPGAFAASYEDEVKRDLDHTFERLANPKATQFVALKGEGYPDTGVVQADLDKVTNTEWLGFIGIFGPLEDGLEHVSVVTDPFVQMTATQGTQGPAADSKDRQAKTSEPMRFHLNGMFVSPVARGVGLGKRLIKSALDTVESEARSMGRGVQYTILLDEWNIAAKNLYEKAGFQIVGRERYSKDAKRLPEGESAVDERVALRMQVTR